MAFWGTVVTSENPYIHCRHDHNKRLKITQASLGITSKEDVLNEKKIMIFCTHGKLNRFVLCALVPEEAESQSLALELDVKDDAVISVIGSHKISLSGYFIGGHDSFAINKYNTTQNSKSYGNYFEDYRHEDDFIDDRNLEGFRPHSNRKTKSPGTVKKQNTKTRSFDEEEANSNKHGKTSNPSVNLIAKLRAGGKQLTPKFNLSDLSDSE